MSQIIGAILVKFDLLVWKFSVGRSKVKILNAGNTVEIATQYIKGNLKVPKNECPPWCSIVGATVTAHQFFCILHLGST